MPFESAYLSDKTTQGLPTEKVSHHKNLKLQHHTKTLNLAKVKLFPLSSTLHLGGNFKNKYEAESQSNMN